MTKEEFIEIVDSEENLERYLDDPDFIGFTKEMLGEFREKEAKQRSDFEKRENKINEFINDLIEKNKDNQPKLDTLILDPKSDESDFYEEH